MEATTRVYGRGGQDNDSLWFEYFRHSIGQVYTILPELYAEFNATDYWSLLSAI